MEYRSTNQVGYGHLQGDLVSNVFSSHGVQLTGGSTGGVVESVGDDANVSLLVQAKGSGHLFLGRRDGSNLTIRLVASTASGGGVFLGSTVAAARGAAGLFSTVSTVSWGALVTGHSSEFTFTNAQVDVNPGDLLSVGLVIDTADLSSQTAIAWTRQSSVATSRVTVALTNLGTTNGSTGSGTFRFSWLKTTQ